MAANRSAITLNVNNAFIGSGWLNLTYVIEPDIQCEPVVMGNIGEVVENLKRWLCTWRMLLAVIAGVAQSGSEPAVLGGS